MKYIVYFSVDKSVSLMESETVFLKEDLTLDQWRNNNKEVEGRAYYDGDFFDVSILMVVLDEDDDCRELLERISTCISVKKLGPVELIKVFKPRVKRGRTAMPPINAISTAEEDNVVQHAMRKSASAPHVTSRLPSHQNPPRRDASPALSNNHSAFASPLLPSLQNPPLHNPSPAISVLNPSAVAPFSSPNTFPTTSTAMPSPVADFQNQRLV